MPSTQHVKAAEHHTKGDHKAGLEHVEKAAKLAETAHEATKTAHTHSKSAAH